MTVPIIARIVVSFLFLWLSGAALYAQESSQSPATTKQAAVGTDAAGAPAGLDNPPLGMGLNGISDWTTQQPFIDVMKTARSWIGHLPDQWGGWGYDDLASRGYLDEHGWLTSMPKELRGVSTLILTDLPREAVSINGRYRMTYAGKGTIRLEGRARNPRREGDNTIWFDTTAGEGNLVITITKTDPEGTGDYIRDIQIVKEENIPLLEVGAIFNPDWIERIDDVRSIRFMDWMETNNSTISEWSQRPKPDDVTYARAGVPVEVMVALANQIGTDPWFTMPHLATDDYMRRFAEYVRDNLDPALKAHVEFSNEVWNWMFNQAQWAEDEGKKRWGQESKWVEFYGMRAAQMARIWDEVYGEQAKERLVKVISTQTGWLGLEEAILTTPLWVAENPEQNRPAASYFDAYAITGYFAGSLGGDDKAPLVKKWIEESRSAAVAEAERQKLDEVKKDAFVNEHAYDQAVGLAAKELRDGSVTGDSNDTVAALVERIFPHHHDVATKYGLDLIMYEGGTHVTGFGGWVDDADLAPFFIHLNYTAEMGDLYKTLLEGWKSTGGTLFNAFVDVAAPTKWGSWGALRHLTDNNPRWDALMTFNSKTPGWWETRQPGAFLHGVFKRADGAGQTLEGTPRADILIGGEGDDLFEADGGSDRIHGGPGGDTAVLRGRSSDYTFSRDGDVLTATAGRDVTTIRDVETLRFSDEPDRSLQTSELK